MLVTVKNAAVSIGLQVSVGIAVFNSFGNTSRNRIAGSYINSMFNFLRNCHNVSPVAAPFYIPLAIYKGSNLRMKVNLGPNPNSSKDLVYFLMYRTLCGISHSLLHHFFFFFC